MRTHDPLPDFLRNLIENPPTAGSGVHAWLFQVARQLHAHMPAVEIVALLEQQTRNCGRNVPRREIQEAVKNAMAVAWEPSGRNQTSTREAKWPSVNQEQREAIIANGYKLADLWEISPLRLEDNRPHTEEIIDRLFPGNPLLCCGKSSTEFDTRTRSDWRNQLADLSYIVPSPMLAVTGITKVGKESKHSLDNTGARRFLVCEFDTGTIDEHAALLLHLAEIAPLVCAVFSGGKSLHGWFYVHGLPDERVLRFFRYAVSIGGDPATWTRSQFVRIPDGIHKNGKRQRCTSSTFNLWKFNEASDRIKRRNDSRYGKTSRSCIGQTRENLGVRIRKPTGRGAATYQDGSEALD